MTRLIFMDSTLKKESMTIENGPNYSWSNNPSICEYATLEEDSSPKKKRPEPKPIIGVKRSLLYFQKAQDLEKWPRKLEDMINFPKPAKPALHLPYLEAPGFTSNQPQEWQPGDLLSN
ncbi:hypothetical protein YC2023_004396 [Brassica napus]